MRFLYKSLQRIFNLFTFCGESKYLLSPMVNVFILLVLVVL